MNASPSSEPPASSVTVTVVPQGWTFDCAPDEAVLDAARRHGIRLPKSCRNGTCRTCLCLASGASVRYRIDWPGLSAQEKADGYILPCIALACGDLTIESPHAVRQAPADTGRPGA